MAVVMSGILPASEESLHHLSAVETGSKSPRRNRRSRHCDDLRACRCEKSISDLVGGGDYGGGTTQYMSTLSEQAKRLRRGIGVKAFISPPVHHRHRYFCFPREFQVALAARNYSEYQELSRQYFPRGTDLTRWDVTNREPVA